MIPRRVRRLQPPRIVAPVLMLTTATWVPWADAATPSDLDRVVERFKTAQDPSTRLALAYEGLDRYAPIDDKSQVDPDDRGTLSGMKRIVITDLLQRSGHNVLVSAIGSAGSWLLRPEMVKNDYDAGNEIAIAKLKYRGYYMEGLSDLDFVVMGPEAGKFCKQVYGILAQGQGEAGLDRDELVRLEISFLVDDQIRSLTGGGPRGFWRQLLDVKRSSPHPEKYITKGGKALYGVQHLGQRGAAVRPGSSPRPMEFQQWAQQAGQDIGPFTVEYLYGGCCDMDYFIRHTWEKTRQRPVKTVLQVLKYLKRQAWMLERAAKNASKLPDGLKILPINLRPLEPQARRLEAFAERAIAEHAWQPSRLAAFRKASLSMSAGSCLMAHTLSIDMGHDLIFMLRKGKLSDKQAVMLQAIAYDHDTVHHNRFPGGRPAWYEDGNPSAMADTLEFLAEYRNRQRGLRTILIAAGISPDDPELAAVEVGPIEPPPVATIKITDVQADPPLPQPGESVTFSVTCEIQNLLREAPTWEEGWLSDEQLDAMRQVGIWSWRAAMRRMQMSRLMHVERNNRQTSKPEEWMYVSPYEIRQIAEDVEQLDDEVAHYAGLLGKAPPRAEAGSYEKASAVPTLQSLKDYLGTLEDNCQLAKAVLESVYASAHSLAVIAESNARKFPKLDSAAAKLSTARQTVTESIQNTSEVLDHLQKYKGWAEQIEKIGQGDLDLADAADKLQELESYLEKLTDEADTAVWNARTAQHIMINRMLLFRDCARSIPEKKFPGLRKGLKDSIREWDGKKNGLILEKIPDLERRALWLKRGMWAASAAKWALTAANVVRDYQETRAKLAKTDLSQQTEDAVIALKAVGRVITAASAKIPIPVLRQVIRDYAGILTLAPDWAAEFDQIVRRFYQGEGYDLRRDISIPAAYRTLISHAPGKMEPGRFYRYDKGPFAMYNQLTVFGYPFAEPTEKTAKRPRNMLWLIWDKKNPDGFLRLDYETFKKASLYATWYRRVHEGPLTGLQLYSLLKNGKIEGGVFFGDTITVTALRRQALEKLRLQAMRDYLVAMAGKREFSPTELYGFYGMLARAAEQLAAKGFILGNDDARRILREARLDTPAKDDWESFFVRWSDPKHVSDRALDSIVGAWDALSQGEKRRLEQAVNKLVERKVRLRADARRAFWEEAKKTTPAGLMRDDVVINVNHTILWDGPATERKATVTPKDDTFTFKWTTTLPKGIKRPSSYICRVKLMDYESSAYLYEHNLLYEPKSEITWGVIPSEKDLAKGPIRVHGSHGPRVCCLYINAAIRGLQPGIYRLRAKVQGGRTHYAWSPVAFDSRGWRAGVFRLWVPMPEGKFKVTLSLPKVPEAGTRTIVGTLGRRHDAVDKQEYNRWLEYLKEYKSKLARARKAKDAKGINTYSRLLVGQYASLADACGKEGRYREAKEFGLEALKLGSPEPSRDRMSNGHDARSKTLRTLADVAYAEADARKVETYMTAQARYLTKMAVVARRSGKANAAKYIERTVPAIYAELAERLLWLGADRKTASTHFKKCLPNGKHLLSIGSHQKLHEILTKLE